MSANIKMRLCQVVIWIIFFFICFALDSETIVAETNCFKPKIYAIQANVTDLNQAVDFYKDLGFDLITKHYYPQVAPMRNGKTMLVLHKVGRKTKIGLDETKLTINMEVRNLNDFEKYFRLKGVEFLHDKTQSAAIGIWESVRDPSGNIVNLVELKQPSDNLSGPKVYNVSIIVTDMDRAIDFYDNVLGFDIFSLKFYPPVVPLRTKGVISNIALHESADKPGQLNYPDGAQTFLNIQVENLESAVSYLKKRKVKFLHDTPQQAAIGIYMAFEDPFGLVHELVELK